MTRLHRAAVATVLSGLLAACSSTPPAPEWQMQARGSLDRATSAWLTGDTRVADAEFARARRAAGSTGRVELVARVELTRCAAQVASLELAPCTGFEPLRADAPAAERAYAAYLAGRLQPQDLSLLPAWHRDVALRPEALAEVADPLARLVAAGALMARGAASSRTAQVAVDTASAAGWRLPLLAWLGVQARLAEQAGQPEEAARLRRRMELVTWP